MLQVTACKAFCCHRVIYFYVRIKGVKLAVLTLGVREPSGSERMIIWSCHLLPEAFHE